MIRITKGNTVSMRDPRKDKIARPTQVTLAQFVNETLPLNGEDLFRMNLSIKDNIIRTISACIYFGDTNYISDPNSALRWYQSAIALSWDLNRINFDNFYEKLGHGGQFTVEENYLRNVWHVTISRNVPSKYRDLSVYSSAVYLKLALLLRHNPDVVAENKEFPVNDLLRRIDIRNLEPFVLTDLKNEIRSGSVDPTNVEWNDFIFNAMLTDPITLQDQQWVIAAINKISGNNAVTSTFLYGFYGLTDKFQESLAKNAVSRESLIAAAHEYFGETLDSLNEDLSLDALVGFYDNYDSNIFVLYSLLQNQQLSFGKTFSLKYHQLVYYISQQITDNLDNSINQYLIVPTGKTEAEKRLKIITAEIKIHLPTTSREEQNRLRTFQLSGPELEEFGKEPNNFSFFIWAVWKRAEVHAADDLSSNVTVAMTEDLTNTILETKNPKIISAYLKKMQWYSWFARQILFYVIVKLESTEEGNQLVPILQMSLNLCMAKSYAYGENVLPVIEDPEALPDELHWLNKKDLTVDVDQTVNQNIETRDATWAYRYCMLAAQEGSPTAIAEMIKIREFS